MLAICYNKYDAKSDVCIHKIYVHALHVRSGECCDLVGLIQSIAIVPEQFLVLFRPGTTSVRSGLGTFLFRSRNMGFAVQKVDVWPMGEVRTADELSRPRVWGRGYSSAAVLATHEPLPSSSA